MNAEAKVPQFDRITIDPAVMGGQPCIRGLRVPVATVLGMLSKGWSKQKILAAYPYLEEQDLPAALEYAAWRMLEVDIPVKAA